MKKGGAKVRTYGHLNDLNFEAGNHSSMCISTRDRTNT